MEHKYSLLIALILFNYRASVSSALFLDGAPEDRQLFVDMVNSGSLGGTWIQTPTSDPSIFSLNMAAPINFAEANYFGIAMNDYASFSTEATLRVGKNLKGVIIDGFCTSIDSDGNCVFTHNNISNGVQFFDLADLLMLPDDAPETFTRSSVIIHGVAEVIASLNNNITYDSYFGEPSAHRSGGIDSENFVYGDELYGSYRLHKDSYISSCNEVAKTCDFVVPWSSGNLIVTVNTLFDVTNVIPGSINFGVEYDNTGIDLGITKVTFSPIPIPAAAWLFGSGLIGMIGVARRKKA